MFNPTAFYLAEKASQDAFLFDRIDADRYQRELADLPSFSIELGGICVGGAVMRRDRFHIAVLPAARGHVGRQILQAFSWGFTHASPLIANVRKDNAEAYSLITRFPHQLVVQDAETLTYALFPKETL